MPDLSEQIEDAAGNPKKVQSDAGSAESHSIPDLIAADRYLAEKTAASRSTLPIRMLKIKPDGTT